MFILVKMVSKKNNAATTGGCGSVGHVWGAGVGGALGPSQPVACGGGSMRPLGGLHHPQGKAKWLPRPLVKARLL